MIEDLKGKDVKVYLAMSPWGDSVVSGRVAAIDSTWLRLETKKNEELLPISVVKRISIRR